MITYITFNQHHHKKTQTLMIVCHLTNRWSILINYLAKSHLPNHQNYQNASDCYKMTVL